MPLFVKIEKGVVRKESFDLHVPAHRQFVEDLNKRGHRARSGHWGELGGGMMLFEAKDRAQAERIVSEDPLVANGCVEFELHEWKIVAGF